MVLLMLTKALFLLILSGITEEEVLRWLDSKAFGIDNPGNDDLPLHGRSPTLHFHKKAISFFIPNKHFKWNVDTKTGNPTMSPGINAFTCIVKNTKFIQKEFHREHVER
jgi:hypothetical protein